VLGHLLSLREYPCPETALLDNCATPQPRALSSRAGMDSLSSVKAAASACDSRLSAWSRFRQAAQFLMCPLIQLG
jgi:hypothetical protein